MTEQPELLKTPVTEVDKYAFEPIKGYPMLYWKGKRPFTSTQYYIKQNYRMKDENGRLFQTVDLTARKPGGDTSYEWKGYTLQSGRYWAYSKANMEKFCKAPVIDASSDYSFQVEFL